MASGGDQGGPGSAAPKDKADRARGTRRRFCSHPRPRCPRRSARLISHLAAPGPVCVEPGIPPAAQTAPAPSLSLPRFLVPTRPPGAWETLCGVRAHPRSPLATAGADALSPSARREGPGACKWGSQAWAARCSHHQGPGAMRTSGHLAWTAVQRRTVARREAKRSGGGGGVPRLGGRPGSRFAGPGERGYLGGGVAGC